MVHIYYMHMYYQYPACNAVAEDTPTSTDGDEGEQKEERGAGQPVPFCPFFFPFALHSSFSPHPSPLPLSPSSYYVFADIVLICVLHMAVSFCS